MLRRTASAPSRVAEQYVRRRQEVLSRAPLRGSDPTASVSPVTYVSVTRPSDDEGQHRLHTQGSPRPGITQEHILEARAEGLSPDGTRIPQLAGTLYAPAPTFRDDSAHRDSTIHPNQFPVNGGHRSQPGYDSSVSTPVMRALHREMSAIFGALPAGGDTSGYRPHHEEIDESQYPGNLGPTHPSHDLGYGHCPENLDPTRHNGAEYPRPSATVTSRQNAQSPSRGCHPSSANTSVVFRGGPHHNHERGDSCNRGSPRTSVHRNDPGVVHPSLLAAPGQYPGEAMSSMNTNSHVSSGQMHEVIPIHAPRPSIHVTIPSFNLPPSTPDHPTITVTPAQPSASPSRFSALGMPPTPADALRKAAGSVLSSGNHLAVPDTLFAPRQEPSNDLVPQTGTLLDSPYQTPRLRLGNWAVEGSPGHYTPSGAGSDFVRGSSKGKERMDEPPSPTISIPISTPTRSPKNRPGMLADSPVKCEAVRSEASAHAMAVPQRNTTPTLCQAQPKVSTQLVGEAMVTTTTQARNTTPTQTTTPDTRSHCSTHAAKTISPRREPEDDTTLGNNQVLQPADPTSNQVGIEPITQRVNHCAAAVRKLESHFVTCNLLPERELEKSFQPLHSALETVILALNRLSLANLLEATDRYAHLQDVVDSTDRNCENLHRLVEQGERRPPKTNSVPEFMAKLQSYQVKFTYLGNRLNFYCEKLAAHRLKSQHNERREKAVESVHAETERRRVFNTYIKSERQALREIRVQIHDTNDRARVYKQRVDRQGRRRSIDENNAL
ncbi:hypothetical protein JAAARDRAFT_307620 [Jaapia argillacea MUCL 33604]|uniref:Uncharacterized protein n=1 Tax=Jaapia argillacea MUCL 33604 TaxID=933084 RepID=A0A067Q126_9AGAM|nr:hypothetical protein JAAARDRAFT_307620 [Jaapia argillacea MUCL 33604]